MKIEAAMRLNGRTGAIDYGSSNDIWVVGVNTTDGNGLAYKIYVTVSIAGVCTG